MAFPPLVQKIVLPTILAPGPYDFTCSANGVSTNAAAIRIASGPPAFAPSSVTVGADSMVSVSGYGFGQSRGNGYIHLAGIGVPDVYVSDTSNWTNTQINFFVPGYAAVGQYELIVHTDNNGDIQTAPGNWFFVVANPVPSPPEPIPLFALPANTPLVSMFVAGPCVVDQSGVNEAAAYPLNQNFWDGVGNGCANHAQQLVFNQGIPQETISIGGASYTYPTFMVPGPAISIPI